MARGWALRSWGTVLETPRYAPLHDRRTLAVTVAAEPLIAVVTPTNEIVVGGDRFPNLGPITGGVVEALLREFPIPPKLGPPVIFSGPYHYSEARGAPIPGWDPYPDFIRLLADAMAAEVSMTPNRRRDS